MKENYEKLDQTDYVDGEYLEKVVERYTPLVGRFLIEFSYLEHELNLSIADFIHDDAHEIGYMVIERLSIDNKIDLFFKMYIRVESENIRKDLKKITTIKESLKLINSFRNCLVHANWQTLTKDGLVRTKIVVDNQNGYVKFKKIEMTPKTIRGKIKEIYKLIEEIEKYKENAFQF